MKRRSFFETIRQSLFSRATSFFIILNLLIEVVSPTLGLALTSGPNQPEFTSFEPVATTNMVNEFSGDFTYNLPVLNVPGPDGGGYSMSLSYHSGVTPEEEASWVGLGWTLNPGAINRIKRGYADEANGQADTVYNKVKPSWTQSARFDFNMEYFSSDGSPSNVSATAGPLKKLKKLLFLNANPDKGESDEPADVSVSLNHTVRYNNYTGFSIANGISLTLMGAATVDMNREGGQNTYGFRYSFAPWVSKGMRMILEKIDAENKSLREAMEKLGFSKEAMDDFFKALEKRQKRVANVLSRVVPGQFSLRSYNVPALSYSVAKNYGCSWNFSTSFQFNPALPVGFQAGVAGNLSVQAPEAKRVFDTYGYIHSSKSNSNTSQGVLYDYQIEKESTFNKHDKYLGIPFNSADMFNATGNHVVGSLRLQHNSIGSYYPNFVENLLKIRQAGPEFGFGSTIQAGIDGGMGRQTTSVGGAWNKMRSAGVMSTKKFSTSLPKMRFSNDLGGEVNYDDEYNKLVYATIEGKSKLNLNSDFDLYLDQTKDHGSQYVTYDYGSSAYNAADHIKGITVVGADGNKCNYGQPVYVRNEANLSVAVENKDGRYIVHRPVHYANPQNNQWVTGTKSSVVYPSTYLLTDVTSGNFVDVDGNGPSEQDLGAWTKFTYNQAFGDNSANWFRFRTPYTGLLYQDGRLMNKDDQTGSISSGEKQVFYLKTIETKSHIAFFVTNSSSYANSTELDAKFPQALYPFLYSTSSPSLTAIPSYTCLNGSGLARYDGIEAAHTGTLAYDPAAESPTAKGDGQLQRLEKIVLFAKSDMSKPISTTYFEYDYSLCPGIPNTIAPSGSPSKMLGKLTLKRLWTESNGTISSRIAPYQFGYEYFNKYPDQIKAKYHWADTISNQADFPINDKRQNPDYKPEALDAWGHYQNDGEARFFNKQRWLSQKTQSLNPEFDPAAWQLKRIQLPSGGEIHIHYEQKEYSYVQDKRAMAMVSLQDENTQNGYNFDNSVYCINETDIGVTDVNAYADSLRNYFLNEHNKLYFKVLYNFTGDEKPILNSPDTKFDYVTGYTAINGVTVTAGNKILLGLGDTRTNTLVTSVIEDLKKDKTLPRYVCYQELLGNGGTNLGPNAGSYKDDDYTYNIYKNNTTDEQSVRNVARLHANENTKEMFKDWVSGRVKNINRQKVCKELNFEFSYFKLPLFKAKRGGGVRVKRLLSYDPGISGETGSEMVYGNEYLYTNEKGVSSGVAVSEPTSMREECALVGYLERKKQKWIDKINNGKDTKQYEGPLGETLLPAASVGHSCIIIKNIHSGKSGTGFSVNRYFTAAEFPFKAEYSDISEGNHTFSKGKINIPMGIFNMEINRAWVTQGYLFKTNDMHGKLKSKTTYAGNYSLNGFNPNSYINLTENHYSQPGASISALSYNSGKFQREYLKPGTEEDYTIFTSNVKEVTNNFSIEFDINYTIPVEIYPTFGFSYSYDKKIFSQHVTSKVVNQVSYLMSTTSVADGVAQTTENIGFDKYTGKPVLTRTYDGYVTQDGNASNRIYTQGGSANKHDGYYYSLNIPASWMYEDMRSKTVNPAYSNELETMAGSVVTYSTNALAAMIASGTDTWSPTTNPLTNVVSASATVFKKNWFQNAGLSTAFPQLTGAVLTEANKAYYPEKTYVYRSDVTSANSVKMYKGGLTTGAFNFFDWTGLQSYPSASVAAEWYSAGKVTKYSPYGLPIEEQDALGISSAAKFGYNNTLPVLVSKNAAFDEVIFTDFEYGSFGNAPVTSQYAHTGRYSLCFSSAPGYVFAQNYSLNPGKGLSVKFWLKSDLNVNSPSAVNYGLKNYNNQVKVLVGTQAFDCKAVAQTGEWTLYSADISNLSGLVSSTNNNITLSYQFNGSEAVFVDDFRIQPLNASMSCSVYNPDNKLAAQFDDQHFGVLFEYNGKGQLVRKSIETERGRKTLQEQQYNTPLTERNTSY